MACNYTLMNKTTPVLDFEYDLEAHLVTRVSAVRNAAAAPVGLFDEHGAVTKKDLNYWWRHRAIPSSREQIERLLDNLKLESTLELAERNLGLSLSDRYWIDDRDNPQRWEDINFFDNGFSEDLGILTLGQDSGSGASCVPDYRSLNLTSPNGTLGGDLLKKMEARGRAARAREIRGGRVQPGVLQRGCGHRAAPASVATWRVHALPPVHGGPPSLLRMRQHAGPRRGAGERLRPHSQAQAAQHRKRPCGELGIGGMMEHLARMFACDFVLANRDRHWRNFGVIRNVETLKGVRPAPVFDSGSCLWSDQTALELPVDFRYTAKPFKVNGMRPYDQLRLFSGHLGWLEPSALDGFDEAVFDILSQNPNIAPARLDAIVRQVRANVETLCITARMG